MRKISVKEFQDEIKSQGVDRQDAAFICPMCGSIQSMRDLVAAGCDQEKAETSIGFNCVGRFTGADSPKKGSGKPCNWSLGGLLRCHELTVVLPDGEEQPFFEVASPEQAQQHAASSRTSQEQANDRA
jgi:hypothetical protein